MIISKGYFIVCILVIHQYLLLRPISLIHSRNDKSTPIVVLICSCIVRIISNINHQNHTPHVVKPECVNITTTVTYCRPFKYMYMTSYIYAADDPSTYVAQFVCINSRRSSSPFPRTCLFMNWLNLIVSIIPRYWTPDMAKARAICETRVRTGCSCPIFFLGILQTPPAEYPDWHSIFHYFQVVCHSFCDYI